MKSYKNYILKGLVIAGSLGLFGTSQVQAQNVFEDAKYNGTIENPTSGEFTQLFIDLDRDGDLDILTTHKDTKTNETDIYTYNNKSERYNQPKKKNYTLNDLIVHYINSN